jgi:hypothetical protein
MDLNVYEDDDDETLHRKLIAAKIARKRAEEDHKLLNNRIQLLKQEEQKVSHWFTHGYLLHPAHMMLILDILGMEED